jgi:hypothetical protein
MLPAQFKMLKEEVIMVRKPAVRLGNVLAGVKDSPVAETMYVSLSYPC